jgi:hypothetical protein
MEGMMIKIQNPAPAGFLVKELIFCPQLLSPAY